MSKLLPREIRIQLMKSMVGHKSYIMIEKKVAPPNYLLWSQRLGLQELFLTTSHLYCIT